MLALLKSNNLLLKVIIILFCISNFSCASFKTINNNKRILLTKENINLIDGIYLNNAEYIGLPMKYFWGKYYTSEEYNSVYKLVYEQKKPYLIKINALNYKNIKITIFVDNKALKSYTLKGELKDGYFEQKGKVCIIPMIFMNLYHSSKFRIGKLKNDNIVTDYITKEYFTYGFSFGNNSKKSVNIEHLKSINAITNSSHQQ